MVFPRIGISLVGTLLFAVCNTDANVFKNDASSSNTQPVVADKLNLPFLKRGGGNPALLVSAVTAQKLSVTEDATDSLDVSIPLSQAPTLVQGRDGPLMRDINMLTDILADIVQRENPRIHDLFEEFRGYGVERYVQHARDFGGRSRFQLYVTDLCGTMYSSYADFPPYLIEPTIPMILGCLKK